MESPPPPSELITSSPQSGSDKLDLQTSHTISAEYFRGPIPPPEALQRYDDISPGMASRLVGMAEAEAKHRHEVESKLVDSSCTEALAYHAEVSKGQTFGLIITLEALAVGGYVAIQGHEWAGAALGSGGIGGIVLTFILGRNAKPRNDSREAPSPNPNPNIVKAKRRAKK